MLAYIMKEYEALYGLSIDQLDDLPRLFSLCLIPYLKFRYITINPNDLAAFAEITLPKSLEGKISMSNEVFDFTHLRINEHLNRRYEFDNLIRSYRFGADVVLLLSSSVVKYHPKKHYLCAVDPGRNQVFTAVYSHGEEEHEVRRLLIKEYYHMIGPLRHVKRERKGMQDEEEEELFP
ncbi:hypothetical protein BDB01DRAFT_848779 [Pilobolus umbonatus]|nr:hypothetical protein BDB01DRAFT_848779 [Pilobolus umbonatus]